MDKLTVDEAAMKAITDNLVDPWHRTFARDVVEMYLEHSYRHPEPRTWNGMEIAEIGEVKTVLLSTQNTEEK